MSTKKKHAELIHDLILQTRHFIARSIFYNQKVAEEAGLHVTDMQCLNLLDLHGPLKPGQLAEFTGLTTGGITVVLDRLEKAKYVRRQPNPNDRRSVFIHVNPARVAELHAPYEAIQKNMTTLLSGFSDPELDAVLKFFKETSSVRP